MSNKTLWVSESGVEVIATAQLDNLANNALALGASDYPNHTNKFRWADFLLFLADFDAAPDGNLIFELHLFYQLDASNHADGEAGDLGTPKPSGNSFHAPFIIDTTDGPQYQQALKIPLSPKAFRVAVVNKCGQDLADASSHFLKIYPYNEDLQ